MLDVESSIRHGGQVLARLWRVGRSCVYLFEVHVFICSKLEVES
jgi:hypothetical protein